MAQWQYQIKADPLPPLRDADLTWLPHYPDRLPARQPPPTTSVLGIDASTFAPDGLPWVPRYPDRIDRLVVRGADQPFFALGAFPSTFSLDHLGWIGQYPARLARAILPPAAMPSFFLGPLVPIPNPTTALIEDRILLGQNQSIETPAYPSIGGSGTWS